MTVQVCNSCSELSSASQEPIWPSFGQTLKMLIKKKKDDKGKQRENVGDVLNFHRVRAIRAFCAKGWTCTGLCEQAILPPDCNASFLYCKQCSVTKTNKQTKKNEIYPANKILVSWSLI